MKESRRIKIPNSLDGLKSLQVQLDDICGDWDIEKKTGLELNLILEELLVNSMVHGEQPAEMNVEIDLSLQGTELVITVTDDGPPFNPQEVPSPDLLESLETRKEGGLGIHLVHHFADSINYTRKSGRNMLTISKYL